MPSLSHRPQKTPEHTHALSLMQVFGLKSLVLSQREVDAAAEALEEQGLLDTVPSDQEEQPEGRSAETNEDAEVLAEPSTDPEYEQEAKDFIKDCDQPKYNAPSHDSTDGEWTPEDYLLAPADFRGQVLAQLLEQGLPKHQLRIAALILESLDGRGFFTEDVKERAEACGVTTEEFAHVLAVVQQCEPAGVAARNAWDANRLIFERNGGMETTEWRVASCMAQLAETGELRALTAGVSIAMSNTDCECAAVELSKAVAGRLGIDETKVRQIIKRLVTAAPHPVDQHEEDVTPWADHHLRSIEGLNPDVAISVSEDGGFTVALCGSRYANLAISKTLLVEIEDFKEQLDSLRENKNLPGEAGARAKDKIAGLTIQREQKKECREHVMQFLRACEDRRTTLLRVATVLAHRQKAYLKSGNMSDLQCFSPDEAGAELQLEDFGDQALSESTVSRALQDKCVRLPNGDVKPLKLLCSPGEKATTTDGQEVRYLPDIVKKWVLDYIRREDRLNPLSDESIAKLIARDEDLVLSRKTIENYRKELEIPSARDRKRKPVSGGLEFH